jgi:hypothetical protein
VVEYLPKPQPSEIPSVVEYQSQEDSNLKPQTFSASAQPRDQEAELQCWATGYTSSHLHKLRVEAGSLQNRICDLSRVVAGSEDDKGVGALRVHSALLSAEVGALETVLATSSNQSSEQAVWTAMQQALKKQHRIELMTLRTAAALSGHQIGILSSSSEASDTSYASSNTSPQSGSLVPGKCSDIEAGHSSGQESTTINDESSENDAGGWRCTEVVTLSSDDEDSSESTSHRDRIPFSPKPAAPGEIAVPLPCWAAPLIARGELQSPTPAKVESSRVAFGAVLGVNADLLKPAESLRQSDPLGCDSRNELNSMPFTPESTSEDVGQLMLQMVGVRKGHQERCAANLSQLKFFEFR